MAGAAFEFDSFRLDPRRRALTRGGSAVTLPRKAFDTLVVLLEEQGNLVTKEALLERVWPGTIVEENSLNQCISLIRKALGDRASAPRYIETIPAHGYRFFAPVTIGQRQAESSPVRRSLAVLPFRSLGAGEDDGGLGIGIADSLIARLSRIERLRLRPTSAVLRYAADDDPLDAGRALEVDTVLEGSLRRTGERLRVSVQLVSVMNRSTVWASTFDERFTEIFAVEDAISQRVAEALTTHLSAEERRRLLHRDTVNSEAYRLYINGRWYADRLTREGSDTALESLRQAVRLDPTYALGHAGLAHHYLQCADLVLPSREATDRAEEAARIALALDERLVEAHAVVGTVALFRDRNTHACIEAFERALALEPHNVQAQRLFGWCLVLMGRFDEGLAHITTAERTDPWSHENVLYGDASHYFARHYDEALARCRVSIDRDPGLWLPHVVAGRALEAKGDLDGAIAAYERTREIDDSVAESLGDLGRALGKAGRRVEAERILAGLERRAAREHVASFTFANVHLGLGDLPRAFARLKATLDERSWYATWFAIDPVLDEVREDARFPGG